MLTTANSQVNRKDVTQEEKDSAKKIRLCTESLCTSSFLTSYTADFIFTLSADNKKLRLEWAVTGTEKSKYVTLTSEHITHSEKVITSCKALQVYLQKVQNDVKRTLKNWKEVIRKWKLMKKCRLTSG